MPPAVAVGVDGGAPDIGQRVAADAGFDRGLQRADAGFGDLDREAMAAVMRDVMSGEATDAQIGGLLVASQGSVVAPFIYTLF